jgi:hypothetical protein
MMSRQERRKIELQERKAQKKARMGAQRQLREEQEAGGMPVKMQKTAAHSKSSFKTVQEEKEADQERGIAHIKTMNRILPGIFQKLSRVKDFRHPGKIKYKAAVLLLSGLLSFVFQKTSRREANRELTTATFMENVKLCIPDLEEMPHHDTIQRFLAVMDINDLEKTHMELVREFITSKKFSRYLLGCSYPIAIDGSQKYAYNFLWAEECQRRKVNGKDQYYCSALEASLAFQGGLTIPLCTEFLDYMEGDVDSDKQDCELKAFRRLARKLKGFFPKLKVIVLLDGLYPNGDVFELCRSYKWQYMIVLQDDSLKSVWEEYYALKDFEKGNEMSYVWGGRRQRFTWVNEISYLYDNMKKEQIVHVVMCEEMWDEVAPDGSIVQKTGTHTWISSEPLHRGNIHERCNVGARHRWAIETGFLVEKRHGYQYEHTFSFNWNAMKGYHLLMRLAHMINIIAQYGSLLKNLFLEKGMRAAIKYLDEIFRRILLDPVRVMNALSSPYQIRFG